MIAPDAPFLKPISRPWIPAEMLHAPLLDARESIEAGPNAVSAVERCYALLINPFYPKDPNASFGKHVLTPTLALTSFAATTPPHWRVFHLVGNLPPRRPPYLPI